MKAGRELDALIAEKVMGWSIFIQPMNHIFPHLVEDEGRLLLFRYKISSAVQWSPSTDIAAAWEVVEKIKREGFKVQFDGDFGWVVYWTHEDYLGGSEKYLEPFGKAGTAPHAICLAALKAVGVET